MNLPQVLLWVFIGVLWLQGLAFGQGTGPPCQPRASVGACECAIHMESAHDASQREGEDSAYSRHVPCTDLKSAVMAVLRDHPELVLDLLREHEIEVADLAERGAVKRQLQAERERILTELETPKVPEIDATRPIRGNPHAPITIVEYSDFECPYCGAAYSTINRILEKYEGKVRFIYKHNPLDFHPIAEPAALLFEAIALQDHQQAWVFHDRVFEEQEYVVEAGEDGLQAIVASLPIDHERLKMDLLGDVVRQHVREDRVEAERFEFDGTPAFLINGVSLQGNYPENDFVNVIQMFLP